MLRVVQTVGVIAVLTVITTACTSPEPPPAAAPFPGPPPVKVCGNDSILGGGPVKPPKGAIVVRAGDNSSVIFDQADKTFWFAPGIHTFGPGEFGQIVAGDGSRYVGAPGAVLDGGKRNRYAITAATGARGVTVEYLTIRNFGVDGGNQNEGVVNQGAGSDWTIRYNTVKKNAGAGLILGSGNVVAYNCLTRNGQYGFNAASLEGPTNLRVDHNEIAHNNTLDWDAKVEGCGCAGGGKFWFVQNAEVTNNYVHHNIGTGLWADTNNRGFLFANNMLFANTSFGIFYETSYNAVIRDNVLVGNGLVAGPNNPSFPTGAIYVSESGGDERVAGRYGGKLEITRNRLSNNWSGVVLWENADRFCGSPANTSIGICTLVDPGSVTVETCNATNLAHDPYYGDCRWRTQNVRVHRNTFELDPVDLGPQCTPENSCGLNSVISNEGTSPDWTPYKGQAIPRDVTFRRDNTFYDNTYIGPWRFLPLEQGNLKTFGEWQRAPYRQDRGSTIKR